MHRLKVVSQGIHCRQDENLKCLFRRSHNIPNYRNNGVSIFYQLLEIGKKYSRFWQHYKSYIKSFPILRYSKKNQWSKKSRHTKLQKKSFLHLTELQFTRIRLQTHRSLALLLFYTLFDA